MKHVDDDQSAQDANRDLLALLDHQALPDPQLVRRFEGHLAARMQGQDPGQEKVPAPVANLPGRLFQRFWPSRPAWAFAYSCCMLVTGLATGQWLPVPKPASTESTSPAPGTALVCPVQSAPSLWLPAPDHSSIA